MITDARLEKLAKNLVNYSCSVKKGEKVWIDVTGVDYQLVAHLVREIYAVGGYPFVFMSDNRIKREILMGSDEQYWEIMAKRDEEFMNQMDAYIGVRGGQNNFELSDVKAAKMKNYNSIYAQRVHHNIRVAKTKWVILRYPTEGMSQLSKMSTERFEDFYFVTVYTPNSQNELARLDYRMEWEDDFRAYLKKLEEKKPVIVTGDMNVAHKEIDLKNPKTNRKNAGFTDEERQKFTELLDAGFIDTFRYFYPDAEGIYSWWSYRFSARAKNAGWRIDYFCVSECLKDRLADAKILTDVMGSDHCPVELDLK